MIRICGLSMEMEMAEEYDGIGKCEWCLYYELNVINVKGVIKNGILKDKTIEQPTCRKHGPLKRTRTKCKDWVVDYR